ncbi:MAG: hypothetical protein C4539_13780 [Ignavibacteriales bacterium]|nr:MAG: hypothetical protein C4539_13780 [Ignavibacteriales bacterium]
MILSKQNIYSVDLEEIINEKISTGKTNELLYIVPTNRKLRATRKEFISKSPGQTLSELNVETLGTLSTKLLSGIKPFKPLTETTASVLLKQSIKQTGLKYFSNYGNEIPEGTTKRISNVISEYKRQGITPEIILKEAESLQGTEKIKAIDISNIYAQMNLKCMQLNVKDIGDIYADLKNESAESFNKVFRSNFNSVDTIIISGFDEFSNPEVELINKLSLEPYLALYIFFDYNPANDFIFSHLNKCYNSLFGKGFRPVIDKTSTRQTSFSSVVSERLFVTNKNESIDLYKQNITEIVASDKTNEIELIAKEIKNLLLEEKVQPHKICVAFNLIEKYSPAVREIFTSLQIPFNLTDRLQLSRSYPVIGIINFLEILENDFYFKNISRALSCGFLHFGNVDLSKILSVAENLKVISGYNIWRHKIQQSIIDLDEEYDLDDYEREQKRKIFGKVLADLNFIQTLLAPFNHQLTLKQFLNELKKLIFTLNLPLKLLEAKDSNQEEHIKAVSVFMDEIEEVFVLLENEYGSDKKFHLGFFLDQLKVIAMNTRFNIKERSDYGVQVTTINEIRGLQFDYLFISGLTEGDFPTRFNPEIFLSGSFQKGEMIHQTEERYHLYQVLSCWNKNLFLTYPLTENEKELVPSNYLRDIKRLFSITTKTEADYSDSMYSLAEVLKTSVTDDYDSFVVSREIIGNYCRKNIIKAISVERLRREHPSEENIYNGYINLSGSEFLLSGLALEKLASYKNRQYSITQLEKYAACPFQYFIERILNIQVIEEPTEEIEALEMGSLLHIIFYEFYSAIIKEGLTIKNYSDKTFTFLLNLIFKIANDKIETARLNPVTSFYEKEKILGINNKKEDSILYRFLQYERTDETGFVPSFFEAAFGVFKNSGKASSMLSEFSVGGTKLRGKIDRIELDENRQHYGIVDYKLSGKKPSTDDLLNGISLQLPVYMLAAKEMLQEKFNTVLNPAGSYIYSLKYNENDFGRILVSKPRMKDFNLVDEEKKTEIIEFYNNLVESAVENIRNYVGKIAEGKFNLSSLKDRETKVCNYCKYAPVCRIQVIR